jgi:hypothetical protein
MLSDDKKYEPQSNAAAGKKKVTTSVKKKQGRLNLERLLIELMKTTSSITVV